MRGFTLIDLMVSVAILAVGAGIWVGASGPHQASQRAVQVEAIVRLLDQEMEWMRACDSASCLRKRTGVSAEADTWLRATVRRKVTPGPDGTFLVTIEAESERVPRQSLTALVRVPR